MDQMPERIEGRIERTGLQVREVFTVEVDFDQVDREEYRANPMGYLSDYLKAFSRTTRVRGAGFQLHRRPGTRRFWGRRGLQVAKVPRCVSRRGKVNMGVALRIAPVETGQDRRRGRAHRRMLRGV